MTLASKRFVVFVLALFLFVWGCIDPGGEPPAPEKISVKGTEGLVMSFFEDAPPDVLYPETEAEIELLLENRGTYSISCEENDSNPGGCGKALIFSREPIEIVESEDGGDLNGDLADVFLSSVDGVGNGGKVLKGRSPYSSGDITTFDSKVKVGGTSVDRNVLIFAIACYPYETSFSTSLCVDASPIRMTEDQKVCNLESLRFESQGAPVAIKKIEQMKVVKSGEVIPSFRIFLKNEGNGLVIQRSGDSFKKMCSNEANNEDSVVGLVTVSAEIGGTSLDCTPEFKLSGNFEKDFIECTASGGESFEVDANSFVSVLSIVLSYGYQTTVSKKIKIETND